MFKRVLVGVDGSDHGYKAARMAGLLLGSQSQKVVHHAPCPVLLVR